MTEEQAAREKLGAWLSAEPGRTWDHDTDMSSPVDERPEYDQRCHVVLWLDCWNVPDAVGEGEIEGHGPTLAAAIIDAIQRAEGGG